MSLKISLEHFSKRTHHIKIKSKNSVVQILCITDLTIMPQERNIQSFWANRSSIDFLVIGWCQYVDHVQSDDYLVTNISLSWSWSTPELLRLAWSVCFVSIPTLVFAKPAAGSLFEEPLAILNTSFSRTPLQCSAIELNQLGLFETFSPVPWPFGFISAKLYDLRRRLNKFSAEVLILCGLSLVPPYTSIKCKL